MLRFINKVILIVSLISVYILLFISAGYSLSTATHRDLNEYVSKNSFSYFTLSNYLNNQLGMPRGYDEKINGKEVFKWISDGGEYEDKPSGCIPFWRSRNHFHNPIDDSGFSGWWDTGILKGISAVAWINQPIDTQSCGHYSWNDAKKYYYAALTVSDKVSRETNFAETFRAIGQMMHLVQDMSVPEHTRNDGHYFFYDYEVWAIGLKADDYIPQAYQPNEVFPLSINNLFDTNQYNGMNPGVTIQPAIGLAEYSNANFLSPDNIFKGFTYPSYSDIEESIDQSTGKNILYLKKTGNGEDIEYLARANHFYKYLPGEYKKLALTLNDTKVYENYAAKLIPRAIGYSAQVLSYFFRGQLEAELVQGHLQIKNASSEIISDGEFSLYYDNENGERSLLSTAQADTLLPGDEQIIAIGPLVGASSYMLIFKGRLGNETDAVIGKYISAASSRIAIVSTATDFIKLKLGSISEQGIKVLSECVMKGVTLSNPDDLASVQVIWDPQAGCYQVFIGNNNSAPHNIKYAVDMEGEIISSKEANFKELPNRYYNITMAKDDFDKIYYRFAGPGAYALLDHEFNIMKGESPVAGSMQDPYLAYRVTKYPTYSKPQPPEWNNSILKTLLDDGTMVIMHGWLSYDQMREWRIIYEDSATHEAKEFLMNRDAYSATSKFSLSNRFLQVEDQLWYVAMTEQVVNTNYRFGLYYYLDTVYTNELRIAALDNPLDFVVAQTEASTFVGSGVHTYWTYSNEGGWVSHEITYRAPTNAVIITRMTYCKNEGIVLISKVRWDNTGIVDWEKPPTGAAVYPDAPGGTLTTYIDAYNTKGVFLYRTVMEQIEVPSVWSYSPFQSRTSMPVQIPLEEWNSYIRHTSVGYTQMD